MLRRILSSLLLPSIVLALVTGLAAPALAEIENPNHGRGFSPEKAFDIGDVDHVNLFNGTLNLTIPVGGSYPLSGGLSYSLTLTYGSALWEWQDFCQFTAQGLSCDYRSSPNLDDNAGFGWRLHMGRLFEPFDPPRNSSPYWVYESPDGGTHTFHATLHDGDGLVSGVSYTRDGSYLRMKELAGGVREIEFPDGTIHKFDSLGRLIQIRNRFPTVSKLDVSRQFNAAGELSRWVLTDSAGRTHRVNFTTRTLLEDGGTWEKIPMVSSVDFQGFGGARRIWSFSYQNATYTAPRVDDEGFDHTYRVPLLTQVTLPDNSSWFIGAANYDFEGRITRLELPTLGKIAWQYGLYNFPKLDVFDKTPTEDPTEDPFTRNRGVIRRTTLTRNNQTEGVWSYSQTLFSSPDRTRTWVTDPLGHERRHHFSADPEHTAYGLPFHPSVSSGGRKLSVETYHANGTKMRTEYVRYEWDKVPFVSSAEPPSDRYEVNRRVAGTRTVYHLDGNRIADTNSSDFDGLGHYRKTTTGGNFGEGDVREGFTNYHRFRGTYQHLGTGTGHTFTMMPTSSAWILGTFNEQWTKEDGVTETRQVCMDPKGFVTRERLLAGSSEGPNDVLRLYARDGRGDRIRERHFGGDSQNISTSTSNVCSLGVPSNEQYSISHTYTHGVLATSRYETSPGFGVGYFVVDQTIDGSTGLPVSSRDPAGIQTTYLYDSLDRRTWARPQSGHGAWIQFGYVNATSTNPARVNIFQWPNGTTGGTALAERQLRFDGFGRLTQERRRKPNGAWATKETGYNALGWKTYETSTEENTNPVNRTSFLQYDPFGRPAIVRPPEGSHHDVTFLYRGVRETERTVKIGTSRNASTGAINESAVTFSEVYDRQGRLWKVWEDEGVTNWLTTYGYDVGNRLSSVSMTRGGTTQQRTFHHDGRGFLLWECHPEKGSFGNGCVQYFDHDAKGHAGRIVDGPQDLTFSYDRAERLTLVRESFGSQRPLKEFLYANSNSVGWSAGKLLAAIRHNYFPEFGGLDFSVEEDFTYWGKGGRVSRLDTYINFSDEYRQDFVWDDLGNLDRHVYPTCQHSPCSFQSGQPSRTVDYDYTNGWLTSVPGWANGIFYHANGLVAQINHANGVVTTQATDFTQRPRPASISVKKGTAPLYLSGSYFYDGAGNVTRTGNDYYLYDRVGRLVEGTVFQDGNNEKQLYQFDGFGNLTEIETYFGSFLTQRRTISVTPSTNRLSAAGYDAAGRQLNWGSYAYSWEPGGHMNRLSGGGNNRFYAYGSDDERAMTFDADTGRSTFRIRGLDGKVVREFSHDQATGQWLWEKDWIHREGKLLGTVTRGIGTRHAHLDHLGTPRVFSDASGIGRERRHYFPFGEEALASGGSNVTLGFTGHELDTNDSTGTIDDLTYMMARYQHPQLGRFLSFDPGDSAKPAKPQTWNKYVYAVNNPLRFVDPDGEDPQENVGDRIRSFVAGMGNALSNNITLGGAQRQDGDAAFRAGQAAGDAASLAFGAVEAALGGSTVVTSIGCAGFTLGGCLPVATPATVTGSAVAAHGTGMMSHAAGNLGGSISQMQSGGGGGGQAAGNLKTVNNNRLKRMGIDAEDVKRELVGKKRGGNFNIAVDSDGNAFLVPVRKGAGDPVPTGFTLEELKMLQQ